MIIRGNIIKIALISSLLLPVQTHYAFGVTCPCKFDTKEYSAVAQGEGYCSATTDNGKDCSITFNGNVQSSQDVKPSSFYGPLDNYIFQLREMTTDLFSRHFQLMSYTPDKMANYLPLMIRSSYASAPFISHQKREELDKKLSIFFKENKTEAYDALTGKKPTFKKDGFTVSKGKIELDTDGISVVFVISMR